MIGPAVLAASLGLGIPDPAPRFPVEASERAVVWNGFDQAWTYNHRLSRLGNYVGGVRCDGLACVADAVRAAATGSGSDRATFRSQVTSVTAAGVGFLQGATRFRVHDERGEGATVHLSRTQSVPARGLLADRDQLHVLLGGFDMRAVADPDKLARLSMAVSDPRYDAADDVIRFDVGLTVRLDCDSAECDAFDRSVDYDVSVVWTLLAADDEVAVTNRSSAVDYAWGNARRSPELDPAQFVERASLAGAPDLFQSAFVAFRSLSVDLDDDHHVQAWSTAIRPGAYDPLSGSHVFELAMLFKQWNALSRARLLSFSERGDASISCDLALVQLRGGTVVPQELSGELGWRAKGGPADPALSQRVQQVRVR